MQRWQRRNTSKQAAAVVMVAANGKIGSGDGAAGGARHPQQQEGGVLGDLAETPLLPHSSGHHPHPGRPQYRLVDPGLGDNKLLKLLNSSEARL